jgi:hypothetical protein
MSDNTYIPSSMHVVEKVGGRLREGLPIAVIAIHRIGFPASAAG